MWNFEHSTVTAARCEQVWRHYAQPESWPTWDHALVKVQVDGPVRVGTTGRLHPRSGPAARFTFTEVTENRSFTDTTRLPFALLDFYHTLVPVAEGTQLTHGLRITGPLTLFFARVIGAQAARDLPVAMETLARQAEQTEPF